MSDNLHENVPNPTQQGDSINDNMSESIDLSAAFTPAIEKLDDTMQNVYSSQQLLSNQLDSLEKVLSDFKSLPEFSSINTQLTKFAVTREKLIKIDGSVKALVDRTEAIKQRLRAHQQQHALKKEANKDHIGIALNSEDEHLLE